jgi:hypothetical protein
MLAERIAKIFEQMSSNTDPPAEARKNTRPTRDSDPAGSPDSEGDRERHGHAIRRG